MTTNFGTIVIKVDAGLGPNAAGAFVALARCGYYNDVIFHRIVPGFVIQAGDGTYARHAEPHPGQDGDGRAGLDRHRRPGDNDLQARNRRAGEHGVRQHGQLAVLHRAERHFLDRHRRPTTYSIFGNVTSGMDVVRQIAQVPTGGEPGSGRLRGVDATPTGRHHRHDGHHALDRGEPDRLTPKSKTAARRGAPGGRARREPPEP